MKHGLYEVRMEMEMPGMPQGMGKQQMTMQNCVTAQDLEGGKLGRSEQQKMEQCEIKNFKMSGNTASYTTVCKGDMQHDRRHDRHVRRRQLQDGPWR